MVTTFTDIAGIPLGFNYEREQLAYDPQHVCCTEVKQVGLQEIAPSLLNKSLRYPEVVYDHHQQIQISADQWPQNQQYDVVYLPAGLLGIEYNKTHIYFAKNGKVKAASVVQVFSGELTILLQRNKPKQDIYDLETKVETAIVATIKEGEKVVVPAGYYYTFVNATEEPIVFARLIANEHVVDYELLRRENGLAYYIIAKNARQEIVFNPRYAEVTALEQVSAAGLNEVVDHKCSQKPLYEEAKDEPSVFSHMLL